MRARGGAGRWRQLRALVWPRTVMQHAYTHPDRSSVKCCVVFRNVPLLTYAISAAVQDLQIIARETDPYTTRGTAPAEADIWGRQTKPTTRAELRGD